MTTRRSYTVKAQRVGRWWGLTVPGVPGVVSQVRNLQQAEEYAREAIAFVVGVAEPSFDVVIVPVLPGNVMTRVRKIRLLQERAEAAQHQAATVSRKTVRELIAAGLTGADAAKVMGVSPQRVSQLAGDSARLAPAATARRSRA